MDPRPEKARSIVPYPWNNLVAVPREAAGFLRDARRATARAIGESKIADVLSELVGDRVAIRVSLVEVTSEEAPSLQGVSVTLTTVDGAVRIALELDRELARTLVGRALGRSVNLGDPKGSVAPEIEGALLAIVYRLARRAHGSGEALRPEGRGAWRIQRGDRRLQVHATIVMGNEAYAVRAVIQVKKAVVVETAAPAELLASLAGLPITLPVVAAISSVRAGDVYALAPGDVWLPGEGWTVQLDGRSRPTGARAFALSGAVALVPPRADRGIAVKVGETGEFVVVGVQAIPFDLETRMTSNHDETTATSDVVLEAPLVMRVEMGAVTLAAREWAALAPGDVIALGRRVNEPVILRIAGTEVARGELVDIEGELGVRIRERASAT
jgi:type III secretion protein Q